MMKKKFVTFGPHVYEECRFLENCGDTANKNCNICRVILMRDRFLGEEFHRKTKTSGHINPYILLIDSAGCNLNCWFCYAHEMIKPQDYNRLEPAFVNPEELAECFICKMRMSHNLKTEDRDRFFSRIRITGGEPLYSTGDTILDVNGRSLIEATIDYYLAFFKEMDSLVGDAVNEGVISLSEIKQYNTSMQFPTWLVTKANRINIRFDTNGILFSKKENTRRFIEGIRDSNLNNLRIEVDYSLKGAAPVEYSWASHKSLPVDECRFENYAIKDHPQYSGLMNIIEVREDIHDDLTDVFSLTIERGINHGKTNGFVNSPKSLDWTGFVNRFNEELSLRNLPNIRLSDVDNPLQYAKQWGYLFGRYHSRGAGIKLQTADGVFDYLPWDPKSKELKLKASISACKKAGKSFKLIFLPMESDTYEPSEIFDQLGIPIKPICESGEVNKLTQLKGGLKSSGNMWVLTGKLENWIYSIENEVWGVREKHEYLWNEVKVDDFAVFYVSKPVGGLIGCGTITDKFHDTQTIWANEITTGTSIYPYKIRFEIIYAIPQEKWIEESLEIKYTGIPFRHGINQVDKKEDRAIIFQILGKNWEIDI